MGRTRRKRQVPGDQVPRHCAKQASENDVEVHDGGLDQVGRDRMCNAGAEDKGGDKVERCSPHHCLSRCEDTCGDDGCDGVCCIMYTVQEVEEQSDDDGDDDEEEWRGVHTLSASSLVVLQQDSFHGAAKGIAAADTFEYKVMDLALLHDEQ